MGDPAIELAVYFKEGDFAIFVEGVAGEIRAYVLLFEEIHTPYYFIHVFDDNLFFFRDLTGDGLLHK